MRINKYIAHRGIASRRKADELVSSGAVKINGKVVDEPGYLVKEDDVVEVNGTVISGDEERKVYYMLNKPEGYVTTAKDQFDRPSVLDLMKDVKERVYPVGRLDYETSGLLIITNDGDLTYALTHPKHNVDKVYLAKVRGSISKNDIDRFEKGLNIDGEYTTAPARLKVVKVIDSNHSICRVTIHEGHNRQVRKMFDAIGKKVVHLKRVKVGRLSLGDLKKGEYRRLSKEEVEYLKDEENIKG